LQRCSLRPLRGNDGKLRHVDGASHQPGSRTWTVLSSTFRWPPARWRPQSRRRPTAWGFPTCGLGVAPAGAIDHRRTVAAAGMHLTVTAAGAGPAGMAVAAPANPSVAGARAPAVRVVMANNFIAVPFLAGGPAIYPVPGAVTSRWLPIELSGGARPSVTPGDHSISRSHHQTVGNDLSSRHNGPKSQQRQGFYG